MSDKQAYFQLVTETVDGATTAFRIVEKKLWDVADKTKDANVKRKVPILVRLPVSERYTEQEQKALADKIMEQLENTHIASLALHYIKV